jgi:hypothetical protein
MSTISINNDDCENIMLHVLHSGKTYMCLQGELLVPLHLPYHRSTNGFFWYEWPSYDCLELGFSSPSVWQPNKTWLPVSVLVTLTGEWIIMAHLLPKLPQRPQSHTHQHFPILDWHLTHPPFFPVALLTTDGRWRCERIITTFATTRRGKVCERAWSPLAERAFSSVFWRTVSSWCSYGT